MSRNTDENRKKYNKKIHDKKRKLQEAEIERKKRFKEIREGFNQNKNSENDA